MAGRIAPTISDSALARAAYSTSCVACLSRFTSSSFSSASPASSSSSSSSLFFRSSALSPSRLAPASISRTALVSRHLSTSSSSSPTSSKMTYTVRNVGQKTILNMVVEIPRWTNAKQEISKDDFLNPIKQDTKKGKLRFVRNCFPHKGYLWNYGAFPRTWEDPNVVHPETKAKGDNDPLDVCEIGELVGYPGQVKQVKVLGVMALLDEEETDWKIIVIDVNDPLAPKLNDIEDVERHLPGLLRATNEWFRIYKIPDGKPENQFAFSGECKNSKYAMDVVHECAEAWEKLMSGQSPAGGISLCNSTLENHRADAAKVEAIPSASNLPPAPIDGSIDKWFFISGAAV
ncbi:inorganic pyrophosphatase [Trichophyton equinum CBS 127.97]|uniref:Inorganic pyrophosphatase n=2 Tax=Trichophyton TaxID=5550 RepID=F2PWX2_TRIEC|nr:inorganic pyrophosphatase [Trichophyton equinum CBS 127.97]